MKIAVYVSSRTTFPQDKVSAAAVEVENALKQAGLTPVPAPFPVANDYEGRRYAEFLKANPVDGVVAVFPNFGDEGSTLTALRDAGVPILFQACPDSIDAMGPASRRDAFCGKISAVNLFRQCGVPCTCLIPHTVAPNSAVFSQNLRDFSAICRVVKGMRRLRTGSIGARCTPFKTVRFDETTLEKYGISNESFDLSEVFQRYRSLTADAPEVRRIADDLTRNYQWPQACEDAKVRIARLAATIEAMIADYSLDLVTLRCWMELEQEFMISPCVVLAYLNGRGITANCEVDTVNAIAMRALSLAADAPATCLDWNNNYGDDPDACVLFHCGPTANTLMRAPGVIVDHPMFARALGAGNGLGCSQGRMRPGEFTCASGFTRNGKLSFYLEQGYFGEEPLPEDFFGCGGVAHFPRLQEKLCSLLRHGFPHHAALSYGNHLNTMREALGGYLHYDFIEL